MISMLSSIGRLIKLEREQIRQASIVKTRAYLNDPLFCYFFPDISIRKKKAPYIFYVSLHYGVKYGEVYATSKNLEGIAIWIPPSSVNMTTWRMIKSSGLIIPFRIPWKKPMRAFSVIAKMHKKQANFPHWYLSSITVDPKYQGKGYASTLLRPMLARIDSEGLPCYLETQNERNISLYEHYGFELIDYIKIPDTEIYSYSMIRK